MKTYTYFEALDELVSGNIKLNEPKLDRLRNEAIKSDDGDDYDKELDEVLDRHFDFHNQDYKGDDGYTLKGDK